MLAEPGEQAPWADVDAVAFQDLREIAHKDGRPRGFDRVGEQDLAFLGFELFGLFVDLGLQPSHAGQRHLFRCHPFLAGHIAAVLADGRQHLMRHPTLELLGLRLPRLHHKTVKTRLGDDERSFTAILSNVDTIHIGDFIRLKNLV